ncbi:HemK2/MTQ2 family protein methyltransferase [Wenjunlia tyrosinilytica]|uniref:Methyltransferase n=1 Tax=Wenjunlia tyrosinilytica TaxID=1544741 RepID=A0A917ZUQ7_9ACTN|nr:HemK2/MTQ2 family protein methyltransferase [Wenjunlia tyrosinilytica]GGO91189.1 methyltransferase [Wenjunlia tyrosinilytica]
MFLLKPPGVYSPQADTDLLAQALRREERVPGARVLDIGTGTGALAVVAAREGAASVTAVDICPRAVLAARLNAMLRGLEIRVLRGDLTRPVHGRSFDVVLTNPPYVPCATEWLPRRGPALAWDAGQDGRAVLDRVCAQAPPLVAPGGVLLMVHSGLCGVAPTLARLEGAGLRGTLVGRHRVPFGPVLRARASWLEARGLIQPGERTEELVVIRAVRP